MQRAALSGVAPHDLPRRRAVLAQLQEQRLQLAQLLTRDKVRGDAGGVELSAPEPGAAQPEVLAEAAGQAR